MRPCNPHLDEASLRESASEIEEVSNFIKDVCRGLSMAPGSVVRIASQYLKNWGIKVTQRNQRWIEEQSVMAYHEEWESGTSESNNAIERAIERAGLKYGNKALNDALAEAVVRVLDDMSSRINDMNREFTIIDIGAGTGDTTLTILDAMHSMGANDLAPKCHFYILEPSFKRLSDVFQRIEEHPLRPKKTLISSNLEDYLRNARRNTFDMAVSSAVFHHMGSLTHLRLLRESLNKNGMLVLGDWYTTIWQHPAYIVPILRRLGMEDIDIRRFESFFRVKKGDLEAMERELTPSQMEANRQMLSYVTALAEELRSVGSRSQLSFLEAHESLDDRVSKLGAVGFETDYKELKSGYHGFVKLKNNVRQLYPFSDIASVVAVAKRKR